MKTFDILDKVIFSVGTWNGDKYTEAMLDDIIKAYNDTRGILRPPIKLGHSADQKLTKGMPAIGWVDNLRKVGNDIVADFKKIPKKIYDLVDVGAYRTVSSEFWKNATINGKKYAYIFKGLAFLGAELPGVDTVDDIINMYEVDDKTEVKIYEVEVKNETKPEVKNNEKSEDKEMNEKEIEELNKRVADLEATNKTASEKYATDKEVWGNEKKELETKNTETETKYQELENEKKEVEAEKVKADFTSKIDKLIEDKKVLPAHKEKILTFMLDMPVGKNFKEGDEEVSYSDMLVKIFSEMPELNINTDENSEAGKNQVKDEEAMIVEYAKENKMTYKKALIELAKDKKIKG